jgi:hypothetical protein
MCQASCARPVVFSTTALYHRAMRMILACLIAIPLFLLAQDPPPAGGPPKGGPRGAPKNLKILKPEEVRAAMGSFVAGLGQQCSFCHVDGDRASDENPLKEVARKMILMTRDINAKFPNSQSNNVTCYTCHRGDSHPLTAPPAKPAAD